MGNLLTPEEAWEASCHGSSKVKSFDQVDDRDMMVTKKARSIVQKHNFFVEPSRIDVRVVHKIPTGFLGGEVLGRCASYGPNDDTWDGSVIMVSEKAYTEGEPVLEGVLRHELAHAIHATHDRNHAEGDTNFHRLCSYLGGFRTWSDYEAALREL